MVMLANLIIGKITKALDLDPIPNLGMCEHGDWGDRKGWPDSSILKMPGELHRWVDELDDSESNVSIITTYPSVIHAALRGDERVPVENIWLALPFDNPTSCRKLIDILERDWLAHFCIADMWMSGRLEHEVNETLKKENQS